MKIIAAAGMAALAGAAWGDQITLGPSKDNTLFFSPTGALSNGAGDYILAGMTGQPAERRGLVRFDLASIPPGSTVTGASLTLQMSKAPIGGSPNPIDIHRVTRDWGEGASNAFGNEGAGTAAQPGDATWIHTFYDTQLWSPAGGEFVATASATLVVGTEVPADVTWSSAGLAADVQGWVNNANANFGWILIGDESVGGTARRFNSRENPDIPTRPRLTVTFTPPPPACYANCDASTTVPVLNVADFTCFLTRYAANDPYANCDASTTAPTLNVADFTCFLTKFAAGCP